MCCWSKLTQPAVVVAGFVVVPAVVVIIEDAVVPAVVDGRVVVVGLDAPEQRFTDPDACAQVYM